LKTPGWVPIHGQVSKDLGRIPGCGRRITWKIQGWKTGTQNRVIVIFGKLWAGAR
jgi:hypothetical protein